MKTAQTGGPNPPVEMKVLRRDDSTLLTESTSVPVTLNGEPAILIISQDITARKQAEAERLAMERRLLHAQKLESLGVLAGGIAHDFNNLLMAVLGNLDVAFHDLAPTSPARSGVGSAVQACRRAVDLTRQMLAYSGKGHFVLTQLDLSELVRENAFLFRASVSRTVTMNMQLAPRLPAIQADPGQVQQIVMNLITNASEAIEDEVGVVTLVTGVQDCDERYLRRSRLDQKPPPGRFVYLEVSDTGCGMDAGTQHRIFDPFFTTKFTGRGLGMAAVMGIVRGHGGAIMLDSQLGVGSTIRVLFPAAGTGDATTAAPAREEAAALPPETEPMRSGTILVVDDEPHVRRVCSRILERLGFQVVTAADGQEALNLFQEHDGRFLCVLLDLTMPGMDGVATFRHLKRLQPDLKVILFSGYDESQAVQLFVDEGLAGFIQKPFGVQELQSKLKSILDPG
jgi:signal transduction histidine kinase/CheY-like chemotaxis protein